MPTILKQQSNVENLEENGICVICQEDMDVPAAIVTLDCGHKFHGACMVKSLYNSTRCPVCRDDPYYRAMAAEDTEHDEAEDSMPHVSFCRALALAKQDRANKTTARMLNTANKHKQAMQEKKRELRRFHAKMAPHNEALDRRIEAYTIKATNAHEKRHKKTVDAIQETVATIQKSRAQLHASKLRIATKYGYVRPRRLPASRHYWHA